MNKKLTAISLAVLPSLLVGTANANAPEVFDDTLIVVYKENVTKAERMRTRLSVGARISDLNKDEIDDRFSALLDGRIAQLELRNKTPKAAMEILSTDPAVKYVEPNYTYSRMLTPDDPLLGDLWGLNNTGQNGGTADADIDAPEAWDISTGSRDVIVAVIDGGVDYTHADLVDNMWVNPGEIADNGIDDDGNGYVDDVYGIDTFNGDTDPMDDDEVAHGSHVAGTIGAMGNNGLGVVGVNHNVTIASCKFLSEFGSGSTAGAIECVNYFTDLKVNRGIDIKATNNSWGGGGFSQALLDAINAGGDAGILFVTSAGNAGSDNDLSDTFPANYETTTNSLVSVGSTNRNDGSSGYNFGLTTVDIVAPGSAILSTVNTPSPDSYNFLSGTSMASPHVTGAAALVWSINPELTPSEMKELLMATGDDNEWATGRTVSGKRLNVFNALVEADPTPGFRLNIAPGNAEITAGESISYTLEIGSVAGYSEEVTLSLTDPSGLATLSATSVFPGDTVTLDVVTAEDTPFGEYSFTIDGVSGDLEKSTSANLYVLPVGLTDFPYAYAGDPVPTLPNEDDPDDVGIDVVINIPDDITVFGVEAFVDISHTWSGDLILTLTSPQGTSLVLRANEGGSTDDIVESYTTDAFNGEVATGDWILNVVDIFNGDNGQINTWNITITGIGEVSPQPPVAAFSFADDGLAVTFTNESTDVNNDIESYLWDFGDGATSTEENPLHIFPATGAYDVSLTATDSEGQSSTTTQSVAVSSSNIEAEVARALLSRFGNLRVDISFTGSGAENVEIFRNGVSLGEVPNNGLFRDRERRVSGTTFEYVVCDETTACSAPVTVSF